MRFLAALTLLCAVALSATADEKIKVLVIDGQNNHDWKSTTPVLKKILEGTDRFTVDVSYAAGAGTWGAVDPASITGRAAAAGILWDKVTTAGGESAQAAVVVRDAEVDGDLLDFGTLDAGQIVTAKAELAALGIVIR